MDVTLRPVALAEYDDYFAHLEEYQRELDQYDTEAGDDPWDPAQHREAVLDDMDGRELLWIEADGERAGLAMVRVYPDFPDESRDVADIAEFTVFPAYRGRGIGTAAVEALLGDHRERGTHSIDASVLRDNPALAFWQRLGFVVRSVNTSRRP
ncbi:MAG: GNAT family N-acetyltransferase [Dehalococcoidia bacterium]|nr:GNAT family N-acetyltransferase [Dehalococcoidia bacterium]